MTKINKCVYVIILAAFVALSGGCSDKLETSEVNFMDLRFVSSNQSAVVVKGDFVSEISSFYTKGYQADKSQWFPESSSAREVNVSETYSDFHWREGSELTFFAYANLNASGSGASISDEGVEYTVRIDWNANEGEDVVLGRYTGDGKVGETFSGTASLKFYHPLSSVVFKVGRIENCPDFKIQQITLDNLYLCGKTRLDSQTIIQDGIAQFEWTDLIDHGRTSQAITGDLPSEGSQIGSTFFLIPQNFAEKNATVTLKVIMSGKNFEFEYPLEEGAFYTGKTTVIEINYTYKGLIFCTPTVTEWGTGSPVTVDLD